MKQETLEEACDKVLNYLYPNCKKKMSSLQYGNAINALKSIANWQVEKIYSEEVLVDLLLLLGGVGRREQLVCSCGSRLVKTTGGYHCVNAKCSV
jgi:hypothetical protein